ncbi:class I SAM-dependent methyltransferase [Rhodopseudomonas pseudopalustris]|uniref:class I SAM-dependent methyltransferase n=1 Tax=Rhodopseudomonas pseudopalustris TaxID=1513892 RepID=UPI003F9A4E82
MFFDPDAQTNFVGLNDAILREHGIHLTRDAVILDYGCGSGRFTYDYHDAGYSNTFGYDVKNYLSLRSPDDVEFFRFDDNQGPADTFPRMSSIPWPDNTFDFVFATSVFEHVIDQETAYREIARVLKPGGWFLNNFPAKWRPIEPHIYVPFGGATHSKAWFRLWASLGIRNEYQTGLDAGAVAEKNYFYSLNGIKYPSGREICRMLDDAFSEWRNVETSFARHSPGRSRYLAKPMTLFPPLASLFRLAHTRVILART